MNDADAHDCGDILEHLYAFHDHELSEEEADHIREHLLACEPCLDRFQVEEALRTLIRKSCNGDAVASEDLYLRVRSTITRTTIIAEAD